MKVRCVANFSQRCHLLCFSRFDNLGVFVKWCACSTCVSSYVKLLEVIFTREKQDVAPVVFRRISRMLA